MRDPPIIRICDSFGAPGARQQRSRAAAAHRSGLVAEERKGPGSCGAPAPRPRPLRANPPFPGATWLGGPFSPDSCTSLRKPVSGEMEAES